MTLDRLADQTAGGVVFVLAVRDFQTGDHEQSRVHAADHRDRARLAALVIAAPDQIAVLAFRTHHRRDIALVRLHPIGAVIDPAGIRIAHDHHVAGADVVAAVMFVPRGTGILKMSMSAPVCTFSMTGPVFTVTGGIARASFM